MAEPIAIHSPEDEIHYRAVLEPPSALCCCSDHTEEVLADIPSRLAEMIIDTLVELRKLSDTAHLSFRELSNQAFYRFVTEEIDKAQAGKVGK